MLQVMLVNMLARVVDNYIHTVTLTSSADILCPGDTVVFTCVTTDTGRLVWDLTAHNNVKQSFHSPAQINILVTVDIFTLTLVNVTNSNTYQSTAVAHNVSVDYDGANVSCSDDIVLSSKLSAIIGKDSKMFLTLDLMLCIVSYLISTISTSQLDCYCECGQLIRHHQLGSSTGHTSLCTQLHCHC